MFRGVFVGEKAYDDDLNNDRIRCAGEGVIDGVDVLSYGELWNADVTAFGIGANLMQTEATYAWVDIMSNITYAPAEVFDAIKAHIEKTNGGLFEIGRDEYYNTYTWHANQDFEDDDEYFENGCSIFDIPDIQIEWGGYWFELSGRDLVIQDTWSKEVEVDSAGEIFFKETAPHMCRFLLGRSSASDSFGSGEDFWVLGQNFFHGYVARFELDVDRDYYNTIVISTNQCHDIRGYSTFAKPFKMTPFERDSSDLPFLTPEEEVVLPTNIAEAEEESKVDYLFWILLSSGTVVVGVAAFLIYEFVAKRASNKSQVRLTNGHSDLRNLSTKQIEALPHEEREALKKLLLASIRGETNALI